MRISKYILIIEPLKELDKNYIHFEKRENIHEYVLNLNSNFFFYYSKKLYGAL